MHRLRVGAATVLTTVLVGAGLVSSPASAQTVLCSGVSYAEVAKCDPGWAVNMSFPHWRMYAGHNCTNYVAYKLGLDGVREPSYLLGNARDWAPRAKAKGVTVNGTPAVGAVGAWPGKNHVVYVEEVGSNYLITSEDNYPGYYPKGMYRKIKVTKGESAYPTQFIHFKTQGTITGVVPTISGATTVGSTLTAATGTWKPSGVTLKQQWLRDGVVISGATATTYVLTASDVGKAISVNVTGSKSGLTSSSKVSAKTAKVTPGGIANSKAPAVSGTPEVGSTLTASDGTWSPSGLAYAYQWLVDGAAVKGATSRTFKPADDHEGKPVTVRVTASRAGYTSASATSPATAAVKPRVLSADDPVVTGASLMMVGDWLEIEAPTWSPSGVTTTYQWFRGDAPVTGGTGLRYKVTKADLGKPVSVRVTGRKSGYPDKTISSEPTKPAVPRELSADHAPTIAGTTYVGEWLTADPGTWSPGSVGLAYQWFRGGVAVKGATRTRYKVTKADLGKRLVLQVTATRDTFPTRVVRSAETTTGKVRSTVTGSAKGGKGTMSFSATVAAPGVSPVTGTVSVLEGSKVVATLKVSNGKASGKVSKVGKGSHTYTLRFDGTSRTSRHSVTVTGKAS